MSSRIRQAVILAGGQGSRLRPYTTILPKPLMPIGEGPILEVILNQLKRCGIEKVIISTGHLAALIEAYFRDGSDLGLHIRYVREKTPLGTAGALKIIDRLDDHFLVMNGDILTTLNYQSLCASHLRRNAAATIAVHKQEIQLTYGVVEPDGDRRMERYIEKPIVRHYVSMGINVLQREAVRFIKPGESLGMPDLLSRLKSCRKDVYCYPSRATWFDIGRPEDYHVAQDYFEKYAHRFRNHG